MKKGGHKNGHFTQQKERLEVEKGKQTRVKSKKI